MLRLGLCAGAGAAPALSSQSAGQTMSKSCGKETAKQTEKQTNDSDSMPGSAVW